MPEATDPTTPPTPVEAARLMLSIDFLVSRDARERHALAVARALLDSEARAEAAQAQENRLYPLVKHQADALHAARLIDDAEFRRLITGRTRALDSYDELRRQRDAAEARVRELEQPWREFDFNREVFVRLREEGYQILADDFNRYVSLFGDRRDADYYRAKADAKGYTKFQAWEFMQLFGPSANLGTRPPFETTVLFLAQDMEPLPDPPPPPSRPSARSLML